MQIDELLQWAEENGAHVEDSAFGKCIMLPGYKMYLLLDPDTQRVEITVKINVPLEKLHLIPGSSLTPPIPPVNGGGSDPHPSLPPQSGGRRLDIVRWLKQVHPIG